MGTFEKHVLELNWYARFGDKEELKQVISRRGKNERDLEMCKNEKQKKARAKRAKFLFSSLNMQIRDVLVAVVIMAS